MISFKAPHIRPTTDRVKESLFNILKPYFFEGARVLDCYAGTGSLGLEALSRGAGFVTFIEQHPQSTAIIKKNIELLGISPNQYQIRQTDCVRYLQKEDLSMIDFILIDPPFTKQIAARTLQALDQNTSLKPSCIISIESGQEESLNTLTLKALNPLTERKFNDKHLYIYSVKESAAAT